MLLHQRSCWASSLPLLIGLADLLVVRLARRCRKILVVRSTDIRGNCQVETVVKLIRDARHWGGGARNHMRDGYMD